MTEQFYTIEDILREIPKEGQELVRRAYEFAVIAHKGQKRLSGKLYIHHCREVAGLLTELRMDAETVAAGLLHDVVEDCDVSLEELEEAFGPAVAQLVDGVTKLEEIDRMGRIGREEGQEEKEAEEDKAGKEKGRSRRDEQELESLRKTFLAMAQDERVMLIKLADRLHNMRTLKHLPPARQERLARETMDTHAPLANWLGIWHWKGELEDLAFHTLNPKMYDQIAAQLEARQMQGEQEIERHIARIQSLLRLEGIDAEITGRPKHIYSIYRKMQRKDIPLKRVYDIHAVRVIVDSIPDCYHTLGAIHSLWTPITGEFDDYIAMPKDNMYQSLHTAVVGLDGKILEVQIRTSHMHRIAEYGIAAHWRYKSGNRRDPKFEQQVATLRAHIEARSKEEDDPEAFVTSVTSDLFRDRVYVFTPKGKVIDLPAGATPIDFAFYIHTEIGYCCRGAKVNGRWVPLDYVLKTGEQVEIITSKRGMPSRDWLNPDLGYVKTARARSKIRRWFRQQDREENITSGRMVLERVLKQLGLSSMAHESVAALFEYDQVEDFLARIGFGDIHSQQIISRVMEAQRQEGEDQEEIPPTPLPADIPHQVNVLGTGGVLTRLARCCDPIPYEPIVGYVTRGRGITVHRRDCPNVLNVPDTERLIEVNWGREVRTFPVMIYVLVHDRRGLLHDLSGVFSDEGINIAGITQNKEQNLVTIYITLEVTDIGQLARVLTRINNIPNVIEARRQPRS